MDSKLCSGLSSLSTNGLFSLGRSEQTTPSSPGNPITSSTVNSINTSTAATIASNNNTTNHSNGSYSGTSAAAAAANNSNSLSQSAFCDNDNNNCTQSNDQGIPLDGRLVYTADGSPVLIPNNVEPNAPPPLVSTSAVGSQWQPLPPALHMYTTNDSQPSTYRLFSLRQSNQLDRPNQTRVRCLYNWLRQNRSNDQSNTIDFPLTSLLNAHDESDTGSDSSEIDLSIEFGAELDRIEQSVDVKSIDDHCPARLLVCFVCRKKFTSGPRLSLHAQQKHLIQMLTSERFLLAKQRSLVATLQNANGADRRPLIAFGCLNNSDLVDSNSSKTDVALAHSNTAENIENETNENTDNFLAELSDLANLEKIAKAAAAALHQLPVSSESNNDLYANTNDLLTSLANTSTTNSVNSSHNPLNPTGSLDAAAASQLAATLNKNMSNLASLLPQLQQQQQSQQQQQQSVPSNQSAAAQQQLQQQQLQLLASVNNNALLGGNLLANAANLNQLALSMSALSNNTGASLNTSTTTSTPNTSSISGQSSAIAGQHHMAMLHSRNSCKTLKCPKCNWHYKYQETLEIHMKEKHPETELNCVYCLANQPHPRLARGETYTCGYKPYRCDVCNYSTTTKGNLSIHMQSDKHINNVQELQNGNLPPEVLQNLVQQQQQQLQQQQRQQEVVAAAAAAQQQLSMTQLQSQANSTSLALSDARPASRQMQSPLTTGSSTRPTSSNSPATSALTGETSPQLSASSLASSVGNASSAVNTSTSTNSTSSNGKAMWRCDVCNYETNVARNLRIHMSSEKHAHNMMLLQQNVKQMQQSSNALENAQGNALLQQLNPQLLAALAAAAATSGAPNSSSNGSLSENLNGTPEAAALADMAYNQAMNMMMANQQRAVAELLSGKSNTESSNSSQQQQQQQRNAMQAMATQLALLNQTQQSATNNSSSNSATSAAAAAVAAAQLAALNGAAAASVANQISPIGQPILDLEQPDPTIRPDQTSTNYDEHHCRLFQCVACTVFTCDSLELLSAHLQTDRTRGREEESLVALSGNYICKLCTYKTNLKANFQLHCKTDKHLQRVQQVNHIKEGGAANEWKLKLVGSANAVQVRCNLCDYYTNSLHKLQLHVANARHEASTRVFLHLQLNETLIRNNECSDHESPRFEYRCEPCSHSCSTIFALLHHLNSSQHLQSENLRQLKLQLQLGQGSSLPAKSLEEEIRELFTVRKADLPSNSQSNNKEDCLTNNNNSSSSSNANIRLLCPLCQEPFQVRCSLEQHLCDVHHVSRDAIQRLMSIVDLNDNQPSPPDAQKENEQGNSNLASSNNNTSLDSNSALLSAAAATAAAAAAAAASNSSSDLNSSTLDSYSKSVSTGDSINTSSIGTSGADKLIYKHRCTQCPLAFKTAEKLTLHSQYHTIRQASQCILCAKSFRSIDALQKHVESSHQDMSPAELDALRVSLAANPFLNNRNESGGILDPSTTRLLRAESKRSLNGSALTSENTSDAEQDDESSLLDASVAESDLQNDSTNQIEQDDLTGLAATEDEPPVESQTAQLEDLLNSQALAESNYSDPARKFKCHRCKVAFTRQSYLTAHNKTLWHRKGEKLTYPMEKYLDPNRPFKCEICKESFTQKNILLVHYNSVSHLHKLKQLIKDGGSLPASADEDLKASLESNQVQGSEDDSASNNNISTSTNQNSENSNTDSAKSLLNELQLLQQQQLLLNAVQANLNQSGSNSLSISNLNCAQCGLQLPNTDSLTQHQQICQLLAASKLTEPAFNQTSSSATTPSVNSSSATESAASALASSKFYSATHASRSKPPVYKHLLETWGYEIVQQFNEHHQRRKRPRLEPESESTGDQEMENIEQTINDPNSVDEGETPIESSGDNQSQPSVDLNEALESTENKSAEQNNSPSEQDSDEKKENNPNSNNNLTESDRCRCETCDKEFSSIWVLKAHQEEVHKDIVKMQTIQDFAEIYRKEFERKNVLVVKSVLVDGPEADSTQSAGANQDTQTASSGALVMNGSANDTSTIDASNSQTNVNSNSNTNENEANNQNAQMNALLGSNPLLCQAFAALMQQQQPLSNNNNNNAQSNSTGNNNNQQQVDMANQMAQLQMNQLLMSMGLAGAMGGNQPNSQQAAALAALGIPPQMLPLMMAGAVQDPMMALFNPMIAAMATNNPLAGAAGLLGMNAETMLAAGLMPAAMAAQAAAGAPSPATANQLMASKTPVPIASPSLSTSLSTTPGPNSSANAAAAAAANAASLAQSGKRARTRITDDQLKILRQYFDINNSPTEEALQEMAIKSQLPLKVIKHWFRNTLFKERQRNKDSPYNFNNPPSTFLNLEEYEKTGEAKITPLDESKSENATASSSATSAIAALNNSSSSNQATGRISTEPIKSETKMDYDFNSSDDDKSIKKEDTNKSDTVNNSTASVAAANSTNQLQQFLAAMAQQQQQIQQLQQQQLQQSVLNSSFANGDGDASCKSYTMSPRSDDSMDSINTDASNANLSASGNGGPNMQIYSGMQFANLPGMPPLQNSLQMALQSPSLASGQQLSLLGSSGGALSAPTTPLSGSGSTGATSAGSNSAGSASNPGKRANRTRFTDYQIKVLQEFFETNAYPKDDDLEYLGKLLGLSPRVIVVWFQNARQKARKVYENQPAEGMLGTTPPAQGTPGTTTSGNGNSSSNQRNAALHYQCKKCQQVFQRYYELIKHQKSSCFKDENPLAAQIKAAQEARSVETQLQSNPVSNDSTSNTQSSNAQLSATSPSGGVSASATSAAVQNGTFQCDKCSLSFNRLDMFREHQLLHLMNPTLFASLNDSINSQPAQSTPSLPQQPPTSSPALSCKSPSSTPLFDLANGSPASVQQQQQQLLLQQQLLQLQQLQQQAQQNSLSTPTSGSIKRKIDDDDDCDSQSGGDGSQCSGNGTRSSSARDKRLRTAILPEQLDYLYQKYQLESNPSRKMLESISEEVGLKKRVVQVWFQNTRARERKGQLRAHQQVIHKRCPFCRALFKARSALESHLATRHADQYTKGEIDIDALPDSDSGDEGQYPLNANSASQQNLLALAGLGLAAAATGNSNNVMDESNQLSNALSSLLAAGGPFAGLGGNDNLSDSQSLNSSAPDALTAQLRKYIEGLTNPNTLDLAALNGLTGALNNNIEPLSVKKDQQSNGLPRAETPLDLTKPIDLS